MRELLQDGKGTLGSGPLARAGGGKNLGHVPPSRASHAGHLRIKSSCSINLGHPVIKLERGDIYWVSFKGEFLQRFGAYPGRSMAVENFPFTNPLRRRE